jgi:competence protein ComEA
MPPKPAKPPEPRDATRTLLQVAGGLLGIVVVVIGMRLASTPRVDSTEIRDAHVPLRIDVNSATEAELGALPRIGPALARRIVEDRSVSGPFRTLEDLDRVPGIGPRTIEAIRDQAVAR